MSNAPSTLAQHTTESADATDDSATTLLTLAESAAETLTTPFQFAGFWSAVLLPFVYAPMLVGAVAASQKTFAVLLAVHAVALVAGHGYRND